MPFDTAFNVFLVFHIFLMGVFTFLWGKDWGYKSTAAFIAGVTAMLSGYAVSVLSLPSTLESVTWFPLVMLFFRRAIGGSVPHILSCALSLSVMFLGGEPSVFYSTVLVLLIYAVWMACESSPSTGGRGLLKGLLSKGAVFLGTVVTAVLLVSFQLFPFLEFLSRTDRFGRSSSFQYATIWSLKLENLTDFILPHLFGLDMSKDAYLTRQNWLFLIYVGIFTVFFALCAILFRKDRMTFFLTFACAFSIVLSLGDSTPLYRLLYHAIPGIRFVRYPVRFLFISNFCLAMLAGAGYDLYERGLGGRPDRFKGFLRLMLIVSFFLSFVLLSLDLYGREIVSFLKSVLYPQRASGAGPADASFLFADIMNFMRFCIFFILGILLLNIGTRLNVRRSILNFSMASLIIADFCTSTMGIQPLSDRGVFHSPTPNVSLLMKDRSLFRFYASPQTRRSCGYLEGDTYDAAKKMAKDKLQPNTMMEYGLYDVGGYESLYLNNYETFSRLADDEHDSRVLNLLNVKYIATLKEIDRKGFRLVGRGAAYLYENENVMPRAFLAERYAVLKDDDAIRSHMTSPRFDPALEVVVDQEPDKIQNGNRIKNQKSKIRNKKESTNGEKDITNEYVKIVRYEPNEVVVELAATGPKFLVLGDQYYPGWKAFLDGKRVRVHRADFVLRAVFIGSAGPHTVRFVFDPFSFKLGVAVSLATALGMAWIVIATRRKKRR